MRPFLTYITFITFVVFIIIGAMACINANKEFDFEKHNGTYQSVDSYRLEWNNNNIKISDIGAGNPCVKGKLYKTPLKNKFILNCIDDEEFDPAFMQMNQTFTMCEIEFTKNTIIIKHGTEERTFKRPMMQIF